MLTSIVLLAGFSTRMGQLKQHVRLGEHSFLQMITLKLQKNETNLTQKIYVGQQNDLNAQKIAAAAGGKWVTNPAPENGPLSSIRLALKETNPDSAILLWPTDHPMISSTTVAILIEAWKDNRESIIVPSNGSKRGHPTIFPAWCRDDFHSIALEDGARKILQMYPHRIIHVMTDDIWTMKNLNTPAMLEEAELWLKQHPLLK